MCNHLISRNRWRVPEDYADTFKVMGEKGVFSKGFQENIHDIEEFVAAFMKFISNKDD
ncbi:MAG: hypothetical protein KAX28_12495, partial [Candidatus Marinimicrobia bacterium]|nr:hypothetical protein [Candidatus Neomarinimicrobiota bacterium]